MKQLIIKNNFKYYAAFMITLIRFFFDIATLRANPQDLAASSFMMMATTAAYCFLSFTISLIELSFLKAAVSALVDTGLLVALAVISLWIADSLERRIQTITALAGAGALLQLIAWPILFWLSRSAEATDNALLFIPRWGLLLLVIWNVLVIAHILRHALSVALPITFGISVLYIYFSIRIANMIFLAPGVG